MHTEYLIIRPDGTEEALSIDLPAAPGLEQLDKVIKPIIGAGQDYERVAVLFEGRSADMFVNENGLLLGLPLNPGATVIYRNNTMTARPDTDPESLPYIVGTAVLFKRRVWF